MPCHPSDGRGIRVYAVGKSVRGQVRAVNQDRLLVVDLGGGAVEIERQEDDAFAVGPLDFMLDPTGAVLMVADGMGGRAAGERASEAAVTVVGRAMADEAVADSDGPAFVGRMGRALAKANEAIHSEGMSDERYRGMGTTATVVGIQGSTAYIAQVGDSRAYVARNRSITRLTRDQSLVQDLIDMGVLSEEDARRAPSNQILQALGVSAKVEPALTYHELRRDDVLLLCSDGLSRVVTDDEVQEAVASAVDCTALCDQLVDLANERGGPDNITLLVAHLAGDGIDPPDDDEVVLRREYSPPTG